MKIQLKKNSVPAVIKLFQQDLTISDFLTRSGSPLLLRLFLPSIPLSIPLSILLSFFLLLPRPLQARWADKAEAKTQLEVDLNFQVKKDGSFIQETKKTVLILKDSAIKPYANYTIVYNGRSEKLDILEAKTILRGKEFQVRPEWIQDKPLASSNKGFDQKRQILIAYPQVQTGAKVYIHYRKTRHEVPYKNFFSSNYIIRNSHKHRLTINSELPLFYSLNKQGGRFFKIRYSSNDKQGNYRLTSVSRRPIFKKATNERFIFDNLNLFPRLRISTNKSWTEMVRTLPLEYEKRIEASLPPLYQKILKRAKKIRTGPEDKIDLVISSLIEKIRYLGDWRPINGGYIPRPLKVIVESGFGDCKDFSISLSALLRALGFKANPVFIYRSQAWHESWEEELPGYDFNHAIVRAEIEGKVFWLDPTNKASFSRGIMPDIAGRPALVLFQKEAQMLRTPPLKSSGSEFFIQQVFSIDTKNQVKMQGEVHFKGRMAKAFAGAELYTSKKDLDYKLIHYSQADVSALKEWKITGYSLKSRIVKDFSIKMSYSTQIEDSLFGYLSSMGSGFFIPLPGAIVRKLYVKGQDRVSDLFINHPQRQVYVFKFNKGIKLLGDSSSIACRIKNPYIDYSRNVEQTKPLMIRDIYEVKQSYIPVKYIKSSEFSQMKKTLKQCFDKFMINYKIDMSS